MTPSQAITVLLNRADSLHIDRALGRTFVVATRDGDSLVGQGVDLDAALEDLLLRTCGWSRTHRCAA